MLHLLLVILFLIVFFILSIPMLLIEWVIGKISPKAKAISSLRIVQGAFKCILFLCGTKVIVKGEERVPRGEAVMYIGNHRSYFDNVITYSRVPQETGYIAKKEMLRYPLLRDWMKNLHCLFLDRKDTRQGLKTILTAIDYIKSGISICVFPEGTRNRVNDTFLPFHEGTFKIASKTGCKIVPMVMVNSAAILEDHMPKIRRATVILEYLEPFTVSELPPEMQKKVGVYARDLISEHYFRLKEEAKENGYG